MSTTNALKRGAIAGVGMSFVGGIGMVEAFNTKVLISPILTMGYFTLYAIPLVVAWISTKREVLEGLESEPASFKDVMFGATVGLFGGVVTSVFVWVIDSVDLTETFPNFGPVTVNELTFDKGLGVGIGYIILISTIAGAIGGAIRLVPDRARLAMLQATLWVLALAFLELVVTDVFEFAPALTDFLYSLNGGLNMYAAAVIFVVVFVLAYFFRGGASVLRRTMVTADARGRSKPTLIALVVLFASIAILPIFLGGVINELLINVALFMLMGLGLNIVIGYAGLLDLGYVAFFAVGAYTTAVLTSPISPTWSPELSWWVAVVVAMLMAVIAGILVGTPVIRMRGDYLAIVTLGFGEIVRILLLSDWLKPYFGGAQGIRDIPGIPWFGQSISSVDPHLFVYFASGFVLIAVYISYRLQSARVGRAWAAMREDEDVAEATGVGTVTAKLLAFVTGAVLASFAGALVSAKVGTVFTNSFDVLVSLVILVIVIVGGMGSIPGVLVGALVMIGVLGGPRSPGLLAEFAQYKLLIYGVILIVMMLNRPEGLIPSARRSRELHHEELSQDAWLDKEGQFTGDQAGEVAV
jgi:branched-chain amino acid transport system permease protein